MKRSEIKRKTSLSSTGARKKPTKPVRYWADATEKRDSEGVCRVCRRIPSGGLGDRLEIAHVSGRKYDRQMEGKRPGVLYVDPVDIVPLCSRDHLLFDANKLDLLPYLTPEEQAAVVVSRAGILAAYKHLTGETL